MNKVRIIIFCSLLISGCQNFFPAPVNEDFNKEQVYVYDDKAFATKALTQNYLKKKLVSLMSPDVKSQKLVKEIYYASYKHRDLMKDVVAETSFKINNKTLFEIIDTDALVIQNKSNPVFLEYINYINPVPDTPSALPATDITYDSVTANWEPVADATSYTLVFNGTSYSNITDTSMTINGLSSGKTYPYFVKANYYGGTSANSNTVSAATLGAPTNGLIAYYPFSGNFNELINGKNGHGNAVLPTTDRNNKTDRAYQFGAGSSVMVPYTSILAPSSQITFSTWLYVTNWSTYSGNARVISKTQGGGWSSGFNHEPNKISCFIRRNGAYSSPGFDKTTLSAGWHNVTCTYDGRYTKAYADGVLKATDDAGGNYPITYSVNNSMAIGAEAGSGVSAEGYHFTGKIDDIRIYNRALSDAEVVSIYNSNN